MIYFMIALTTCRPYAAQVVYGDVWWPSSCSWIVPGTWVAEGP